MKVPLPIVFSESALMGFGQMDAIVETGRRIKALKILS
jgi:hypothetical protein